MPSSSCTKLPMSVGPGPAGGVRGAAARLRAGRVRRPRAPQLGSPASTIASALCAAARVRHRPAGTDARPCNRDARASGPFASSTRRCARRSGSARTSSDSSTASRRYAAVNESVELVRRAARRAVPFANAVLRRLADGIGPLLDVAAARGAGTPTPTGSGTSGGASSARRTRSRCMRAQNEPPETVVRLSGDDSDGEETDVPGAWRVDARRRNCARGGADLAAEPRLAARRARCRLAHGRADTRRLRRAGWQGDDARRRGRRGRGERGTRPRARGERAPPRRTNVTSSTPMVARSRPI